jgi:hypothetical protein
MGGRYYSPVMKSFISPCNIDEILYNISVPGNLNAYSIGNPMYFPVNSYNIFTSIPLVPETGTSGGWNWLTFWSGVGMVVTAVAAIAISVKTFGAGIPLAMKMIAGTTIVAGAATGVNGVATIGEAATGYNLMRDGLFEDTLGWDESAYYWYEDISQGIAIVGSITLGVYQMTGQYKAAKYGQKYLGKGYVKEGPNRWVSKDGMRQMRWDKTRHYYKGKPASYHFNLEKFRNNYWQSTRNKLNPYEHLWYEWFRFWIT